MRRGIYKKNKLPVNVHEENSEYLIIEFLNTSATITIAKEDLDDEVEFPNISSFLNDEIIGEEFF